MDKWFGFRNAEDMAREFEAGGSDFPTDEQVLFAARGYGCYCGDAFVLFEHEGKLFEVNASHCSCNGIEGQWNPEETSWEALAARKFEYGHWYEDCPGAQEAVRALIATRVR